IEATARARRTPRRKVLLACSATRPPSARRRLITELPETAPSPSRSWHTLMAVCSSSANSICAAVSAVWTASFAAVSSATFCLSSEERKSTLATKRNKSTKNRRYSPVMFFYASSLWVRAASSSEDKEASFSLRAAPHVLEGHLLPLEGLA